VPARRVIETNGAVWWRIPKHNEKDAKGNALRSFEEVTVQWNAGSKGDVLFVDQGADRIEMSLGQVYDVIDALNNAIGKPIATAVIRKSK
jgi:hypothetical protein